jgi:thiamine-monophosphate kinase
VKLEDLGEFQFIDRIAPGCVIGDPKRIIQGIGDDAAVVVAPDGCQLLTTDMLVERVHFVRGSITPRRLGYKALAVNLADIAAMGGTPHDAYVSLAIPRDMKVEELDQFYDGAKELAHSCGVNLLGGDTAVSEQDLCISIVVTGSAPPDEVLYRSGARVGDRIVVTGTLGDSAGGLEVLRTKTALPESISAALIEAHHAPALYLEEARILASSGLAHSGIDLSDGLSSDLRHICSRSGVGAVIDAASIPLSEELKALCSAVGKDPIHLALSGGEDYRLMATVDPAGVGRLSREIGAATGRNLYDIGEIVPGDEIVVRQADGATKALTGRGWDHFHSPGTTARD